MQFICPLTACPPSKDHQPKDTIPHPLFLCGALEGVETLIFSHWKVCRSSLKRLLWEDTPPYPPNTNRHDPTTAYAVAHSPGGGVPWVGFCSHCSMDMSNTSSFCATSRDFSFDPAHPPHMCFCSSSDPVHPPHMCFCSSSDPVHPSHMCSLLSTATAACPALGNGSQPVRRAAIVYCTVHGGRTMKSDMIIPGAYERREAARKSVKLPYIVCPILCRISRPEFWLKTRLIR